MANEINASGNDIASRTDRQRASEGGSLLFPAQTAKGDVRLLEAVKTPAPGQQITRREPSDVVDQVNDTTKSHGQFVIKSGEPLDVYARSADSSMCRFTN